MGRVKVRVTASPTEKPTRRGGGLEALAARRPGQHTRDPGALPSSINAPGYTAQGMHAALELAAVWELAVPAGQTLQVVEPARLNLPAGHAVLLPFKHTNPGSHGTAVGVVLPSGH